MGSKWCFCLALHEAGDMFDKQCPKARAHAPIGPWLALHSSVPTRADGFSIQSWCSNYLVLFPINTWLMRGHKSLVAYPLSACQDFCGLQ